MPFENFINTILPSAILVFGLLGNTLGLIVITRKPLAKIGPQLVLTFLFVFDSVYFILIIMSYLWYGYGIDMLVNRVACKVYWFLNYALAIMSPLLIVYISIERFISLAYPSKQHVLKHKSNQWIFIFIVTIYNLILYIPISIYFDTYDLVIEVTNRTTNQTVNETVSVCNFITLESQISLSYIDLFNRVLIPTGLMIIFTVANIITIFKSRKRMATSKPLYKDVKFSIASIILNLVYLVLSLPVSIVVFFPDYAVSTAYIIANYFYFASYGVNFYLMISLNSLFRKECLSMLKKTFGISTREKSQSIQMNQPIELFNLNDEKLKEY